MSAKRKTITLMELADKFADEESARKWFEDHTWPDGERWCPRCGCGNTRRASHRTMPYWCPDCRKYFSVKTGSAMDSSNLPLRTWAWAVYLEVTSPKGLSSLQLERYLGVWFTLL